MISKITGWSFIFVGILLHHCAAVFAIAAAIFFWIQGDDFWTGLFLGVGAGVGSYVAGVVLMFVGGCLANEL